MIKQFLIGLILGSLTTLSAQNHIGVNLRMGVSKAWKIKKKLRIEAEQQLQLNPELTRDQKKFGDIFNEINLFPEDDADDDGIEDSDDDDNSQISTPLSNLNDDPFAVLWEWRSASRLTTEYRLQKWLRVGQVYTLNYRKGNDIRHAYQANLTFVGKVNDKFELTQRFGFQTTSRYISKKDETIWEKDYQARTGAEWKFKKKHALETEFTVNGAFDDGQWEWDRLRLDLGLSYQFSENQSFDFGYRFQRTLDKKKLISHGIAISYGLEF
jgi:hypothetical protein